MRMMPVTTLTAAILGLLLLILSIRVMQMRFSGKVSLGHGENETLHARIRSHANLAEHVPLILILMALIERAGGARLWLEIAAALLIAGRLIHPIGMARPAPNPLRAGGMILTWAVLGWLAVWALLIALRMWSFVA